MKNFLLVTTIIFGVALIAAAYFYFTLIKERDSLKTELNSVQNTLTSTQSELASTKDELDTSNTQVLSLQSELNDTENTLSITQTDLKITKQTLDSTQGELETTKKDLTSTQSQLGFANEKISSLQQDIKDVQETLATTQDQLDIVTGTLNGLGITISASNKCLDVELVDNPEAKNPTTSQLLDFLGKDQTEKHSYVLGKYDCSQFSRDLHNNAEAAGIRAAEVQVNFEDEIFGHALNAFLTTDCGLVYVDCTEEPDKVSRVKVGKDFRSVEINRISYLDIRNDLWWDSLTSYYYIGSGGYFPFGTPPDIWVTSNIVIYW
jgi:predicted nuclease with TOPRIM domain